jgi:DNA repair exonuclease SbcCD ATPase subunit
LMMEPLERPRLLKVKERLEDEFNERLKKELLERKRLEREHFENERLVEEQMDRARLERERERLERLRLEDERLKREYERLESAYQENERLKRHRRERDEKELQGRQHEAYRERLRQEAQNEREQKRQREQEERGEWDQSWSRYQEGWASFKTSVSRETNIRDAIPWPVKSGSYRDVSASNVKEFFKKAVPLDANVATLMKKECLKWHPNRIKGLLRDFQLTGVDKAMVDMIYGVITDSLNNYTGRSSNFLG